MLTCTPCSRPPAARTRSGGHPGREHSTGRKRPRRPLRYSGREGRAPRIRADRRLDRLRAPPQPEDWTIAAWSPSGAGPAIARAEELIDEASDTPARAIHGADLVVIAAPPLATLQLIDDLAGPLARRLADAVITDVVSTKARSSPGPSRPACGSSGGHPMAGREVGGFDEARAELFSGRPWVVVPAATAEPGDRERVEALAQACGGMPVAMAGGRPRHGRRRDQPPAARGRRGARRVGRRRGGRAGAAGLGPSRDLAATAGRGHPPRPRRRRDGHRDRRHERPGDRRGCASSATSSTRGWPISRPEGPDAERIALRLAAARQRLLATDAAEVE